MIKAVYVLKADNGFYEDLSDLLKVVSGRTAYQVGCVETNVWHNVQTSELLLIESWESMEDLMIHISSKLFKRLLDAMEMCSVQPDINYIECTRVRGMDLIEEVRLKGDRINKQE